MKKPTNPAYLGIAVTFAAAGLVFWLSGNAVGIAFLPIGITFFVLAFQQPKPDSRPGTDRRSGSSDGGSPIIAAGDGGTPHGGRADAGDRPDPSPSPGHDGSSGGSDGGSSSGGGSDGGGSSDGGGGGGGD